jgi:hypothetical protein
MQAHNIQDNELVKIARAVLEGTYTEATAPMDDETVINTVKKLFPSGAAYQKYDNSLYWEKSGGYAGEKSLEAAREKLEKAGFKYAEAKLVGLPDGSTSGFKTYLLNKKLGWYVTLIQFYGQTSSSNRYSLSLKKVVAKA